MLPLTPEEELYLELLYFNPKNPGSYQSPQRLKAQVDKEGKHSITLEQIVAYLQDQESYSVNRKVFRNFQRSRVLVTGIDDQWEADLADVQEYKKDNENVRYLLFVIDVFTRFLWVEPLSDKTSDEVADGFDAILKETQRHPRRLRTDGGSEFTAVTFEKMLKGENISHIVTHSEKQANYVERVIQTIKKRMLRYMIEANTREYLKILPPLVFSYNHTWHSGIENRPVDITSKADERKLWWQTYWGREPYSSKRKKKVRFKFNLGDIVRMSVIRSAFQREYMSRWTMELFKISDRFVRQGQPIYKLVDWANDPVKGTFYEPQLQRTKEPAVYKVEKIVKYKGKGKAKKALVQWKGWPKKFNSWEPAAAVLPA